MYTDSWCTQCGKCCHLFDVNVTEDELKTILATLSETEKEEFLKLVRPEGEPEEKIWHWKNPCYFIQKESDVKSTCRIHSIKPAMCRDWGETQCQKVLDRLEAENPTPS